MTLHTIDRKDIEPHQKTLWPLHIPTRALRIKHSYSIESYLWLVLFSCLEEHSEDADISSLSASVQPELTFKESNTITPSPDNHEAF